MTTFTLDTSGYVPLDSHHGGKVQMRWGGLTPFTQGYIEALLKDFGHSWADDDGHLHVSFSDLAPEALAAILADCERYRGRTTGRALGALFWKNRQGNHESGDGFPPLSPRLGDDGKVYLS